MTSSAALEVDQLEVCYGGIQAVRGISFSVNPGEIVAMIGANGAGKSSTLRAIAGAVPHAGVIRIGNQVIRTTHPEEIVRKGLSLVPEGRGIFANLSIEENLRLGAWTNRSNYDMNLSKVFGLFPRLKERRNQMAGTLSGGEQQMLAMGRALMSRSEILLLDEPSMGLAPKLVREIFAILRDINQAGVTLLVVEQNAVMALRLAHRACLLELGAITLSGTGTELLENPKIRSAYLGH
ncbi:MAG: ABC transporter ATP-binding protein [Verrucomicrobiota bacterium]|jgi:branched-chain amino acid transport system ATP-binding protein